MTYRVPIKDINFNLKAMSLLQSLQEHTSLDELSEELVDSIIAEHSALIEEVIAPLNRIGDTQPPIFEGGAVKLSPGFAEAIQSYAEGGWQSLQHGVDYGGQGLCKTLATVLAENLNAANMAFALCPILTDSCIEAILRVGTDEQKQRFLPALIEGRWTGTMNLTEPQAGSDLALLNTKAVKQDDGSYRLTGQKIFITWGEHDAVENIIHLVLARTPDAPAGVKGLSLFIVPKFLIHEDGSLGPRNDVYCASLEHKLGIHGSPTAVMLFGEDKGEVGAGAIGYILGEENDGLRHMFIMMNEARFAIGLQGTAIAERAQQLAWNYAAERKQGVSLDKSHGNQTVTINHHPDVRRMLVTMKALIEGSRAIALYAAYQADLAKHHKDISLRSQHQALYEYLVPIVKGYSTEMAQECVSLALQVHGGMGYMEETGVAQLYRDARILPIYEGTTAIQANDIVGRKTLRDEGAVVRQLIKEMQQTVNELSELERDYQFIAAQLERALACYDEVVKHILTKAAAEHLQQLYSASVPYLMLAGYVHSTWQLARQAIQAAKLDLGNVGDEKLATALFHAVHITPRVEALASSIINSDYCIRSFDLTEF